MRNLTRLLRRLLVLMVASLATTAEATMPAPDLLRECSACRQKLVQHSIVSGNTFGARSWTDGKMVARMLPDWPRIVKCPKCEAVFWFDDAPLLAGRVTSQNAKDGAEPGILTEKDYLDFLARPGLEKSREIYARCRAWWCANDRDRDGGSTPVKFSVPQQENLQRLLPLLNENLPEERVMKAELLRELGRFPECLGLLSDPKAVASVGLPARVIQNLATLGIRRVHLVTPARSTAKPDPARLLESLASSDPEERIRGVTGFSLVKPPHAPRPLVQALTNDPSPQVRSWAALVLGEIGDEATIPVLIGVAQDKAQGLAPRASAVQALGQMRAKAAAAVLPPLFEEDDLKVNAAIAWSKITGQRHPLVPEGYRLDPPRTSAGDSAPAKAP